MSDLLGSAVAAIEALFEDYSEETCEAAGEALRRWIGALENSVAFEHFLAEPMVDELFASGDPDLDLWGDVASALLGRAKQLGGREGALLLGWAFWCRGETPLALVWPEAPSLPISSRGAAQRAFLNSAEALMGWLSDASAPCRSAAAHALAWSTGGAEVIASLRTAVEKEADPTALASMLLALRVLEPGAAHATEDAGELAWVCSLVGVVDRVQLTLEDGVRLMRAGCSFDLLPAEWGWRSRAQTPLPQAALALALANQARFSGPEAALEASQEFKLERDALGVGEISASALVHLGFRGRGVIGESMGLTVADLDSVSRAALARIAGKPVRAERPLQSIGLPAVPQGNVVGDFLGEVDLDWRVFDWPAQGGLRRWHFGRLWGEVVAGKADSAKAAQAIVGAFSPDDAARLVTRFGISRMPAWNFLGDSPELWSRDQGLALEVFERVGPRVDWQSLISEVMSNTKGGLPGVAALGYLRFSPAADVAAYPELIAKAQAEARVKEPLASVIANWGHDNDRLS